MENHQPSSSADDNPGKTLPNIATLHLSDMTTLGRPPVEYREVTLAGNPTNSKFIFSNCEKIDFVMSCSLEDATNPVFDELEIIILGEGIPRYTERVTATRWKYHQVIQLCVLIISNMFLHLTLGNWLCIKGTQGLIT